MIRFARHPSVRASLALGAALLAASVGAEEIPAARAAALDERVEDRDHLIDVVLGQELGDRRVLEAMRRVPRHRFVPEGVRAAAYENRPLPIGERQTISQPLVVALMTHLLDLGPTDRVLEIGTGSGYQAAVLAELAGDVYSIEILEGLAATAAATLSELGWSDVHLRVGDGYLGWPEAAPFQAVIVTCAPDHVPTPLQEQLAEGGRLVIPVGSAGEVQHLVLVRKQDGALTQEEIVDVRFVPMTGEAVDRGTEEPVTGAAR